MYKYRRPEDGLLYKTVQQHLETFLAERRAEEPATGRAPIPKHVEEELRAFLRCGVLAHGFLKLHCAECKTDHLLGFSCRKRGFCSSCGAKRAEETAIHLTENVLPPTAYRQYVLTFPHPMRFWLAASKKLLTKIHRIAGDEYTRFYSRKAAATLHPETGGVTFVQRFGSSLNLNVHFHSVVIEGVFNVSQSNGQDDNGKPKYFQQAGPDDANVGEILACIVKRTLKVLRNSGYLNKEGEPCEFPAKLDPDFDAPSSLADAVFASSRNRIAFGPRAGQMVRRIGPAFGYEEEISHLLCLRGVQA
jgi:hypothetical protein